MFLGTNPASNTFFRAKLFTRIVLIITYNFVEDRSENTLKIRFLIIYIPFSQCLSQIKKGSVENAK